MISISLILPVLNAERFLRDALESVAAQTLAPQEIIVMDGCSTDATPDIARAFPNVRYLTQTGRGMWNAVNEGIACARGQALAFLSSDDLMAPDKLRLQGEWMTAHPETLAVFCHAQFQELEEGSPLAAVKPQIFQQAIPTFMIETMLARRVLFEKIGNFPEERMISGDIEWYGRMFDAGTPTHMLPDVLLTKRFHSSNLSTAGSSAQTYNRELLDILRQRISRRRQHS